RRRSTGSPGGSRKTYDSTMRARSRPPRCFTGSPGSPERRSAMWLIALAVIGLLAPGGLFMYWVHSDYTTISAALSDGMAMAYLLDLVMCTFLLGYLFA